MFLGGAADHLANDIITQEGLESEAAHKARLALMLGKAKFNDFNGVLQTYEDIKANGGLLDTSGYNALILAMANKNNADWTTCMKEILMEMKNFKVLPDKLTLLSIFKGFKTEEDLPTALATLAEFKNIGVSPCLGVYR